MSESGRGWDDRDLDALRVTLRYEDAACEGRGRSLGKERRKKSAKWAGRPGMRVGKG